MKRLPLKPSDAGSRGALESFLEQCRERAAHRGRPQLASITIEAGHLDPLAVLESIYEPGELHFYCERPSGGMAIAAAEAVVQFSPEGETRFDQARRFVEETLENTVAIGDLDLPFGGPHFLSTFGFFDRADRDFPFPAATLFVPRWQVARRDERFSAVANILVAEDAPIGELAERVWRANAKFHAFSYGQSREEVARAESGAIKTVEVGAPERFLHSVDTGLELIRAGSFKKIVLARALDAEAEHAVHPLTVLNTLRGRFQDCFAFSVGNGRGQSFIGASPERLVRMRRREVLTEALAGSAPRGRTASEDAAFASELLNSEKDLYEHGLVVDSLIRRLGAFGLEVGDGRRARLKQFSNVQHLYLPVTVNAPDDLHVLDVVAALHPTPAVGGSPRESACPHIRALEPFPRGLYAAPLGWVDSSGDGEFFVAIRSALIDGNRARLFAGAGIVEGSEAEREFEETELKFRALLDVLREQT